MATAPAASCARPLPMLSDKALSDRLAQLAEARVVERDRRPVWSPRVGYTLTLRWIPPRPCPPGPVGLGCGDVGTSRREVRTPARRIESVVRRRPRPAGAGASACLHQGQSEEVVTR
ncbi:winged helix-turn-helix transcriptional regulator [Streptomyces sp. NPDC059255]|uniref:winged helix-turn-helix transcriptional regulator n=1 Tax=Streptomyces sp. NPDC059255 TaxID=3346793 RepID=UPI003691E9D1